MKRWIGLWLSAWLLLATDAAAAEKVTLRVSWWGSQERHNRTLRAIELFEQRHPEIDVLPEFSSWTEYWTKLTTQAAARNLPDVIQHDYQYLAEWVQRGLLMPLDGFVNQGVLNLASVPESQLAGGRIGGTLYGVNLGTNALAIAYDPQIFARAGLDVPKPEWTWQDFMDISFKMRNSLGIYGMGSGPALYDMEVFKIWLKQHGNWIYDPSGTDLGYRDDALFARFFEMILELQRGGGIPTRDFDVARGDIGVEGNLIVTGQAAMAFFWSNQLVAVSTAAGRPLKLTLFPRGGPDRISGVYLKPSMFFSISAQTAHPREAAMFIDFITNSVEANSVLMAERGVPISPAVRAALTPRLGDMQRESFGYVGLVEVHGSPINPPDPPGHSSVLNNVYLPLVDQVLYEAMSPQQAAGEFRRQALRVLRQSQ